MQSDLDCVGAVKPQSTKSNQLGVNLNLQFSTKMFLKKNLKLKNLKDEKIA